MKILQQPFTPIPKLPLVQLHRPVKTGALPLQMAKFPLDFGPLLQPPAPVILGLQPFLP